MVDEIFKSLLAELKARLKRKREGKISTRKLLDALPVLPSPVLNKSICSSSSSHNSNSNTNNNNCHSGFSCQQQRFDQQLQKLQQQLLQQSQQQEERFQSA
eukprot:m.357755 g.357755  ORF g.357755 m.357755 type:complete len:101 (-) comp55977_c1_seq19:481-783(-)